MRTKLEQVNLRCYEPSDCEQLMQLFYDTVHTVNARHYSARQLAVWAPLQPDQARWHHSLSQHYSIVAEVEGVIIGFGDMDYTGYLDRLYVHRDYQRQGVATRIVKHLEMYAKKIGADKIWTASSITAVPAFQSFGYVLQEQQQVERAGETLINYRMVKQLS